MNLCKNCSCELDEKIIDKKDPRYCIKCANNLRNFIKGRNVVLTSFQALPLSAKITKTKQLITEAIDEFGLDHVYISYSGGKDSTVLSHIAKQMHPNILHIFANTTCEYPETIEQVMWEKNTNNTNIIIVLPKNKNGEYWNFKKVVDHYGYPIFSKTVSNAIRTYRRAKSEKTKQNSIDYINRNFKKYDCFKELNISDRCCEILKKNPLKKKAKKLKMECAIIGTLADESRQRKNDWLKFGCNVFHKRKDNQCRPLSFWTNDDILSYIQEFNVHISKLYSLGYSRNGCMYCGFGLQFENKDNNRFTRLKQTHPKQYEYFKENFNDFMNEIEEIENAKVNY